MENPETFRISSHTEHSEEEVLGALNLALEELDWELTGTDEDGQIVILTGIAGAANNEIINFKWHYKHYEISSQSIGEIHLHPEENRWNVELLDQKIKYYLQSEPANTLKSESAELLESVNESDPDYSGFAGVLRQVGDTLTLKRGGSITLLLVVINILVFVIMAISGAGFFEMDGNSLITWGGNFTIYTLGGEYWRLLSNTFLHAGIMHLAFNVYGLLVGGMLAEAFLGKRRFITAYLVCGVAASAVSLYMHDEVLSVGASGAIFGCFGIVLGLASTKLLKREERNGILIGFGIFVTLSLVSGMKDNTDNWAHIGGLACGWVSGVAWSVVLKRKEHALRRRAAEVLIPALALGLSALLLSNKPNTAGELDALLKRFDEQTRMAVMYYPENQQVDSSGLQKLRDSGIHYLKVGEMILEEAYSIRGLSAERKKYLNRIRQMNSARYDAFYYTYLMYTRSDSLLYADSLRQAVQRFTEAESAL